MPKKPLENRYGLWTVLGDEIYHIMPSGRKVIKVLCRCDCGEERFVQKQHLLSGASTNCGCDKAKKFGEMAKITSRKHGMEGTIPYRKFMSAIGRCTDPNNHSYYRYGGRGIKVIWKNFAEFWKDMGDAYYKHVKEYGVNNTTLDRIDYNGNYCKENCRWATREMQYNNMSTNHKVTYKGKIYNSIAELAREKGIKYGLLRDRIRYGWSVDDAINLPIGAVRDAKKKGRKERNYL